MVGLFVPSEGFPRVVLLVLIGMLITESMSGVNSDA